MAEGNQDPPLDPNDPVYEVNHELEVAMIFRYTETITQQLLFAIDLMEYSMSLGNLRLPDSALPTCCRRDSRLALTDFDDLLKRFVELYLPFVLMVHKFPIMDQMDRVNYDIFKKIINYFGFANERSAVDESTQSRTQVFWDFCLETVEMSIRAYQHGMRNAPHFGIMIMCRTLFHFNRMDAIDNENMWDSMHNMADHFVQVLEPRTHGRSV